jgi:hypothetical protein
MTFKVFLMKHSTKKRLDQSRQGHQASTLSELASHILIWLFGSVADPEC